MFRRSLFVVIIFFISCTPARFVVPLSMDQIAVSASAGGPMIGAPVKGHMLPVPLPFSSISLGKGITDDITGYASIFPTTLLLGNFQLEVGGSYRFWKNEQFGATGMASLNLLTDHWDWPFRVWPQINLYSYYQYQPEGNFLYTGLDNWFELVSTRNDGLKQKDHWFGSFALGHVLRWHQIDFTIEFKYQAIGINNHNPTANYQGINSTGVFGGYIGITWRSK